MGGGTKQAQAPLPPKKRERVSQRAGVTYPPPPTHIYETIHWGKIISVRRSFDKKQSVSFTEPVKNIIFIPLVLDDVVISLKTAF